MKSMDRIWRYIESDYQRWTGYQGDFDGNYWKLRAKIVWMALFGRIPGFTYCFWLRLAHEPNPLWYLARWMHYRLSMKYGCQILWPTKIGYGLRLEHPFSIVINVSTTIGDNCTIMKGVNIGSVCLKAAELGKCVYVGPNATIIENVHLGDFVTVGGGSVVLHDAPANSTIAGNPARVVSWKDHADMRVNIWAQPKAENNNEE